MIKLYKNIVDNLGFEIVSAPDNQNYEDFIDSTDILRLKDHSECACLIVCIATHGNYKSIKTSDGQLVNVQDLINKFPNFNCRSINNKPKIFLINACRKGLADPNCPLRTDDDEQIHPRILHQNMTFL